MNYIWITILCVTLFYTDKTPSAAASVKPGPKCGPTCRMYCPFGFVLDHKGCPICKCKTGCRDERQPLKDFECGRVKPKCPHTHGCVFPKKSKTGVCCPAGYY